MSNVNTSLRVNLVFVFIVRIVAIPRIWLAEQRLTLNRIFPDVLFSMFREWYGRFEDMDIDFDELFPNLEVFIQSFEIAFAERVFPEYGLKLVQQDSKSSYNLSRYPFKYRLSIRLSKLGLELYSHVLLGEDALEDIDKYRDRQGAQ